MIEDGGKTVIRVLFMSLDYKTVHYNEGGHMDVHICVTFFYYL